MTPMMQQLQAARDAHPGMVILFQNGEFFELFGEDWMTWGLDAGETAAPETVP